MLQVYKQKTENFALASQFVSIFASFYNTSDFKPATTISEAKKRKQLRCIE